MRENDENILKLNSEGKSDKEIADILNKDVKYINERRIALNLPKNYKGKPTRLGEITYEILLKLYSVDLKSCSEIAKLYNTTDVSVGNLLKKYKITCFSSSERRDKNNPNYKLMFQHPENYIQELKDLTRTQFCEKYNIQVTQYNELKEKLNIEKKRSGYSQWRGINVPKLSEEQLDLIVASMLGDGKLRKEKYGTVYSEFHAPNQYTYLYKKANILENVLDKIVEDKNGKFILTKPIPELDTYFTLFYPKGKGWKVVPDVVIKKFKIHWLAYWFFDDGSMYDCPRFSNKFINKEQLSTLQETLLKNGIEISVATDLSFFDIRINSLKNFYEIIKKYVTPDLLYKVKAEFREGIFLDRADPIWRQQWESLIREGFPYPQLSEGNWEKRFKKLQEKTKKVASRENYTALCNQFYPHMWDYLYPIWENKEKVLENRIKYADRVSKNSLLTGLRLLSHETRSNFEPLQAKVIWEKLANRGDEVLLDFSSGFGGRLLGCFASKNKYNYVAIDPWDKNLESNLKILDKISAYIPDAKKRYKAFLQGSEDFIPELESGIDVAFSSPPYFNYEKYTSELTQSYNKYPDYSDWLEKYWRNTIKNINRYLRGNGTLGVNIKDIKGFRLEEDTCRIVEEENFQLIEKYTFTVSSRQFIEKKESVFIFKRLL